jgi:hypothetical protein
VCNVTLISPYNDTSDIPLHSIQLQTRVHKKQVESPMPNVFMNSCIAVKVQVKSLYLTKYYIMKTYPLLN